MNKKRFTSILLTLSMLFNVQVHASKNLTADAVTNRTRKVNWVENSKQEYAEVDVEFEIPKEEGVENKRVILVLDSSASMGPGNTADHSPDLNQNNYKKLKYTIKNYLFYYSFNQRNWFPMRKDFTLDATAYFSNNTFYIVDYTLEKLPTKTFDGKVIKFFKGTAPGTTFAADRANQKIKAVNQFVLEAFQNSEAVLGNRYTSQKYPFPNKNEAFSRFMPRDGKIVYTAPGREFRIDLLKDVSRKIINRSMDIAFNTIDFSSVAVVSTGKQDSLRAIDNMVAENGTRYDLAIEKINELLKEKTPQGKDYDNYLVFVSDGEPTLGEGVTRASILQAIIDMQSANPKLREQSYAIGLGPIKNNEYLQLLAGAGKYIKIPDSKSNELDKVIKAIEKEINKGLSEIRFKDLVGEDFTVVKDNTDYPMSLSFDGKDQQVHSYVKATDESVELSLPDYFTGKVAFKYYMKLKDQTENNQALDTTKKCAISYIKDGKPGSLDFDKSTIDYRQGNINIRYYAVNGTNKLFTKDKGELSDTDLPTGDMTDAIREKIRDSYVIRDYFVEKDGSNFLGTGKQIITIDDVAISDTQNNITFDYKKLMQDKYAFVYHNGRYISDYKEIDIQEYFDYFEIYIPFQLESKYDVILQINGFERNKRQEVFTEKNQLFKQPAEVDFNQYDTQELRVNSYSLKGLPYNTITRNIDEYRTDYDITNEGCGSYTFMYTGRPQKIDINYYYDNKNIATETPKNARYGSTFDEFLLLNDSYLNKYKQEEWGKAEVSNGSGVFGVSKDEYKITYGDREFSRITFSIYKNSISVPNLLEVKKPYIGKFDDPLPILDPRKDLSVEGRTEIYQHYVITDASGKEVNLDDIKFIKSDQIFNVVWKDIRYTFSFVDEQGQKIMDDITGIVPSNFVLNYARDILPKITGDILDAYNFLDPVITPINLRVTENNYTFKAVVKKLLMDYQIEYSFGTVDAHQVIETITKKGYVGDMAVIDLSLHKDLAPQMGFTTPGNLYPNVAPILKVGPNKFKVIYNAPTYDVQITIIKDRLNKNQTNSILKTKTSKNVVIDKAFIYNLIEKDEILKKEFADFYDKTNKTYDGTLYEGNEPRVTEISSYKVKENGNDLSLVLYRKAGCSVKIYRPVYSEKLNKYIYDYTQNPYKILENKYQVRVGTGNSSLTKEYLDLESLKNTYDKSIIIDRDASTNEFSANAEENYVVVKIDDVYDIKVEVYDDNDKLIETFNSKARYGDDLRDLPHIESRIVNILDTRGLAKGEFSNYDVKYDGEKVVDLFKYNGMIPRYEDLPFMYKEAFKDTATAGNYEKYDGNYLYDQKLTDPDTETLITYNVRTDKNVQKDSQVLELIERSFYSSGLNQKVGDDNIYQLADVDSYEVKYVNGELVIVVPLVIIENEINLITLNIEHILNEGYPDEDIIEDTITIVKENKTLYSSDFARIDLSFSIDGDYYFDMDRQVSFNPSEIEEDYVLKVNYLTEEDPEKINKLKNQFIESDVELELILEKPVEEILPKEDEPPTKDEFQEESDTDLVKEEQNVDKPIEDVV